MKKYADIYYEQYLLGELASPIKEELEQDPDLQDHLSQLKNQNSAFFKAFPHAEQIKKIEEKHSQEKESNIISFKKRAARTLFPLTAVAAVFLVLFLTLPVFRGEQDTVMTGNSDNNLGIRIKGAAQTNDLSHPALRVYKRMKGGETEELHSGSRAAAGDKLQLSFFLPEKKYGAIFSLDGNNYMTLHYPENTIKTIALEAGQEFVLPYAYELDDAPRFETFYLIYSDSPLPLEMVSQVLEETRGRQLEKNLKREFGNDSNIGIYSLKIEKR